MENDNPSYSPSSNTSSSLIKMENNDQQSWTGINPPGEGIAAVNGSEVVERNNWNALRPLFPLHSLEPTAAVACFNPYQHVNYDFWSNGGAPLYNRDTCVPSFDSSLQLDHLMPTPRNIVMTSSLTHPSIGSMYGNGTNPFGSFGGIFPSLAQNKTNDDLQPRKTRRRVSAQSCHMNSICSNCLTRDTSMWRRSELGEIECNACNLYFRKNKTKRPLSLRKGPVLKRNRKRRSDSIAQQLLTSFPLAFNKTDKQQQQQQQQQDII